MIKEDEMATTKKTVKKKTAPTKKAGNLKYFVHAKFDGQKEDIDDLAELVQEALNEFEETGRAVLATTKGVDVEVILYERD